jgi:Protein of unknown function (DUF3014)
VRADTHDQLRAVSEPKAFPLGKFLIAIALLVGLVLFWLGSRQEAAEPAIVEAPVVPVSRPAPAPAPDIPQRVEPVPIAAPVAEVEAEPAPPEAEPTPPPLPTAQESNQMLSEQMALAGADGQVGALLGTEHPLEVSAALIDGMSRGVVLRKILPADPPKKPFEVTGQGEVFYMSPESYARYDGYAKSIAALDTSVLINSFHLLRPVYERAYGQLGLDAGDFDNAIIRTLNIILATPEFSDPVPLQRKSVMYTYADSELEQLPSVQKQLLRMGPENIRLIKTQAQALKDGLLAQ